MLIDIVKKGSADRSATIKIIDSTDGTPETAVEHNTAGISLWYRREGAAKVAITPVALADLTTAHTDGGIEAVGDGEYRLDLPDAALLTGANYVDIGGTVTDMIVIGGRIRLVDVDLEDTVRMGMTALPNAAADAAGGLPISDAGGLDIDSLVSDLSNVLSATALTVKATISAKTSETSFTIPSGLSDDLTDGIVLIYDASDSERMAIANLTSYTSSTGVVVISAAPSFTIATASDTATLIPLATKTLGPTDFDDDFLTAAKVASDLLTAIRTGLSTHDENTVAAAILETPANLLATNASGEASADVTAIGGNATSATNLSESTRALIPGTVVAGTLSTTTMTTDLSGYPSDTLIGRLVVFNSGTADGQGAVITGYNTTNGQVSFDALAVAPVADDTFVIA